MNPKFSIIVPIYNLEDCLDETLTSIGRQSCKDFECICINDGSTDRSGAILDEHARECPQIRAIHTGNAGVCAARNRGLDEARGDWIIFLDGDDVLHSRCVEICEAITRKFPEIDFVTYEKNDFSSQTWAEPVVSDNPLVGDLDVHQNVEHAVFFTVVWRFCYRHSLISNLRFDERIKYNMGEDCVYVAQFLDCAEYGKRIQEPLVGYRLRSGSAVHSKKTVEKWHYDLIHRALLCGIVARSKKQWSRSIRKTMGLDLTEGAVSAFEHMPALERDALYADWRSVILDHMDSWDFPLWIHFVLKACKLFRGRMVPILLCVFPRWCKVKVIFLLQKKESEK